MSTRKPLIAGNWKMNLNHLEAIAVTQKLAYSLEDRDFDAVEVAVLPPFTDLRSVQTLVDGDRLKLSYGAQDISPEKSGAFTGDISGAMLKKLDCTYVESGAHVTYVINQLRQGLKGFHKPDLKKIVFAYEPVWAIGTGKTATPDDAQEVCAAIRLELADIGSDEIAQNARILYGGSVKSANIVEIMRQSDIDGALVGGASLDAEEFARLCKFHRVL